MADTPTEWQGILDADETILWQGRPDDKIVFEPGTYIALVFGLFFAGFAVFWMIMASQAGGIFWMFGLLHFFVGLGVALGSFLWPAWVRRHTWYTLTSRRAFIATCLPLKGRDLKSYPLTQKTVLDFHRDDPASIYFDSYHKSTRNGSKEVKIGFERINEGDEVYRLMRDIQRGKLDA